MGTAGNYKELQNGGKSKLYILIKFLIHKAQILLAEEKNEMLRIFQISPGEISHITVQYSKLVSAMLSIYIIYYIIARNVLLELARTFNWHGT